MSDNPFKKREESLAASKAAKQEKASPFVSEKPKKEPKGGRPSSAKEETFQVTIRLTEKQIDMLEEVSGRNKPFRDKSSAVRAAIDSKFGLN